MYSVFIELITILQNFGKIWRLVGQLKILTTQNFLLEIMTINSFWQITDNLYTVVIWKTLTI